MPFVEAGESRLHYLDVGTGDPPVVLLHAFPLQAEMWAPQVACLAAGHRLIVPDLAGFGHSDPPGEPAKRSIDHYADDLAALLGFLGVTGVVLGGLSMGGYVAFSFLRRHRDRVRAVVLADTRAAADTPEVLERRSAQQALIAREGTANLRHVLVEGLLSEATLVGRPALVEHVLRLTDNSSEGFVAALEAMKGRPDHTEALALIDVPTLVLVGEEDKLSPPEVVRGWQEGIAGSRLVVLPGAGHLSNLEAPDQFNAAVADFLDEL